MKNKSKFNVLGWSIVSIIFLAFAVYADVTILLSSSTSNKNVTTFGNNITVLNISTTSEGGIYNSTYLFGFYGFDGRNATHFFDRSSYARHFNKSVSGEINTSGIYGGSLQAGAIAFGHLTPSQTPVIDVPFTITAWIKPTAVSGSQAWIGYTGVGASGWLCRLDNADIRLYNSGGTSVTFTDLEIVAGQWNFVVCGVNSSGGSFAYHNLNKSALTSQITSLTQPNGQVLGLTVGSAGDFGATYTGQIDEVMIFNSTALNDSVLAKIYNNQSVRFLSNGTQTFFANFSQKGIVNVSLANCYQAVNSNLTVQVNSGARTQFNSTCGIANYNVSGGIVNANVTLFYQAGTNQFESPVGGSALIFLEETVLNATTIQYPTPYTMYQRNVSTNTTDMIIRGTYTGTPSAIEANWNNLGWQTINSTLSGGVYNGIYTGASIGQGNLTTRFLTHTTTNTTVNIVGVGDIIVYGGASNCESISYVLFQNNASNPYIVTNFNETTSAWGIANDPVDPENTGGNWMVPMSNYLVQRVTIPIAMIPTCEATSIVYQNWNGTGADKYDNMASQISKATNGTNRVRALVYQSGGNECSSSPLPSYDLLYSSHIALTQNFSLLTSGGLVGITMKEPRLGCTNTTLDHVRTVQRDLWINRSDIIFPAGMFSEIELGPDAVHHQTENGTLQVARQAYRAIASYLYGVGIGRGPQVLSVNWTSSSNNDSITVTFSNASLPLRTNDYVDGGPTDGIIRGFRISNGTLLSIANSSQLGIFTNISLLGTNQILISLSQSVSGNVRLWYSSGNDGYNTTFITDSSGTSRDFDIPAEPFYNYAIGAGVVSSIQSGNGGGSSPLNIVQANSTGLRTVHQREICQSVRSFLSAFAVEGKVLNEIPQAEVNAFVTSESAKYRIEESIVRNIMFNYNMDCEARYPQPSFLWLRNNWVFLLIALGVIGLVYKGIKRM